MRYRVVFTPEAAKQARAARDWWLENRDKAPALFVHELRRAVERLRSTPRRASEHFHRANHVEPSAAPHGSSGEWHGAEFKASNCALPKSVFDAVSAFANTCSGWIVLGGTDSYRNAVVEHWRGGVKLVPADWPRAGEGARE